MNPNDTTERPVRVGMISLGCAKNLVDAEIMLGALIKDGRLKGVDVAEEPALAKLLTDDWLFDLIHAVRL